METTFWRALLRLFALQKAACAELQWGGARRDRRAEIDMKSRLFSIGSKLKIIRLFISL
ncbi:hypothetical protein [Alloprevotella tannerae]|uniref:Uncharacterized protein n=1 Tax=Alloprevotella tannerae TaxID=76122 RepID=A0A929RWX2_9BACT|nr:hypothetical protein [Alloprevotella tannerae]MBF0970800.1 hypothetical protein [Alloprevotella tannerae]